MVQANEAFTQARIDETEHKAKEAYFKALSKATQLYTKLGKQVNEGTTFFTACQERLDALLDRMRDLQVRWWAVAISSVYVAPSSSRAKRNSVHYHVPT